MGGGEWAEHLLKVFELEAGAGERLDGGHGLPVLDDVIDVLPGQRPGLLQVLLPRLGHRGRTIVAGQVHLLRSNPEGGRDGCW